MGVFLVAFAFWFLYKLIVPFISCCKNCSKYTRKYSENELSSNDFYENISSEQLINEYEEVDLQITHYKKIESRQATIKALNTIFLK